MSRFATSLEVSLVSEVTNDSRGTWKLLTPLVYVSDLTISTYTIPTGFETDFATIPRIPVIFALFGDCAHKAAVLHDWLYSNQQVTRDIADKLLLEAMHVTGLSRWRRYSIYYAVRWFGKDAYGTE